jgi:catechol 2,3-dioxygenase-like lactoylglutathione lyase family enzyme
MTGLHGDTIPILASRDVDETAAFYLRLGFEVVARYDDFGGPYLLLRRDEVELHFVEDADVDPARNDGACYLRVVDAQGIYDEWARLALDAVRPIGDKPWGMREFAVVDPSGNLLRIGTPLSGR